MFRRLSEWFAGLRGVDYSEEACGMRNPTHQEVWAGALVFFVLFNLLFVATELGEDHSIFMYLRAVTFGMSVIFACVGFVIREREADEPVFRQILAEREKRLRGEQQDAA